MSGMFLIVCSLAYMFDIPKFFAQEVWGVNLYGSQKLFWLVD